MQTCTARCASGWAAARRSGPRRCSPASAAAGLSRPRPGDASRCRGRVRLLGPTGRAPAFIPPGARLRELGAAQAAGGGADVGAEAERSGSRCVWGQGLFHPTPPSWQQQAACLPASRAATRTCGGLARPRVSCCPTPGRRPCSQHAHTAQQRRAGRAARRHPGGALLQPGCAAHLPGLHSGGGQLATGLLATGPLTAVATRSDPARQHFAASSIRAAAALAATGLPRACSHTLAWRGCWTRQLA
jgi:hypothetical protein